MDKPRLQWCKHACEAGCAIHDQARPDICTQFHCYWQVSGWGEDLRPDNCGVIFRHQGTIRTVTDISRMVLVADLRDRYANRRRTVSRQLDRLVNAGHVIFVSHAAATHEDDVRFWLFQSRLYPRLTDRGLMKDYLKMNAALLAQNAEFYDRQCVGTGYEA